MTTAVFQLHGWPAADLARRIVGHDAQAVWTGAYTADQALWRRIGRRVDPTGTRHDGVPIIDVDGDDDDRTGKCRSARNSNRDGGGAVGRAQHRATQTARSATVEC